MSTKCHDILAAVALSINALNATDPVELQTVYTTRPLTDANFISSVFPMSAIIDRCVQSEEALAQAIGLSGIRPLRAYLRSETAALASGADLPSTDVNGDPIVGNFGAVIDVTVPTQTLTRKPVATILNYLRATGIYLVSLFNYALDSGQILHTRTTVTLECCVYNAVTQTAAYNNDDNTVMPDSLVPAIIDGALMRLVRDDEFMDQAGRYGMLHAAALAAIPPAQMEQQAI